MSPRNRFQIVIIGAGVNGAATAFFPAACGITDVVVLDRDYLTGQTSGGGL
jgi:sarcosine oxidase subunit beta